MGTVTSNAIIMSGLRSGYLVYQTTVKSSPAIIRCRQVNTPPLVPPRRCLNYPARIESEGSGASSTREQRQLKQHPVPAVPPEVVRMGDAEVLHTGTSVTFGSLGAAAVFSKYLRPPSLGFRQRVVPDYTKRSGCFYYADEASDDCFVADGGRSLTEWFID